MPSCATDFYTRQGLQIDPGIVKSGRLRNFGIISMRHIPVPEGQGCPEMHQAGVGWISQYGNASCSAGPECPFAMPALSSLFSSCREVTAATLVAMMRETGHAISCVVLVMVSMNPHNLPGHYRHRSILVAFQLPVKSGAWKIVTYLQCCTVLLQRVR